jgi:hypothetical protein
MLAIKSNKTTQQSDNVQLPVPNTGHQREACFMADPLDALVRQSHLSIVFTVSQRPALLAGKLPQLCQSQASVYLGSPVGHRCRASGVSSFERGLKPA